MSTNKNTEASQGDGGLPPPPAAPRPELLLSHGSSSVIKSGPLFISSRGIGWTSWKKRWFVLTRTSLVFYRSDPNVISQRGNEVNLTLGGIDLNNSGSVVVKADKKLLTVSFPDGRDGRAFTLKAETLEDLNGWKTALESALSQAPNAALVTEQNGILKNELADGNDESSEQSKDKQAPKNLVIGRPILLALEDVDGSPSFLEKALRFIEEHGVNVEGILRQAASVDDVERRIREYEQGKTEFSKGEDAHVIGDCVKYFLRELPSSPVPASCCNALLEACRTSRENRVNAMRVAILETFPEPNRQLLQRILIMMETVASHKAKNRMSTSAVAACMAPLLLRPLLSGDCEIENDFDVGGDGSAQLLQAAAAANHAQAIVITLLEEYDSIFREEGLMSPGLYSDSDYGSEDEELTEDDESYEDDEEDDEGSDAYTDDNLENESSGTYSESGDSGEDDSDSKDGDDLSSSSKSVEEFNDSKVEGKLSSTAAKQYTLSKGTGGNENKPNQRDMKKSGELSRSVPKEATSENKLPSRAPPPSMQKSTTIANGSGYRRPTVWGRTSAKKNLSMESIDFPVDEMTEIQSLEAAKIDLQSRISEEVKVNAVLETNLEQRKKSLQDRRLALEKEVARLREELHKERERRLYLEAQLNLTREQSLPDTVDERKKVESDETTQAERQITNLSQKLDDLALRLNQQREENNGSTKEYTKPQSRRTIKVKDNEAAATTNIVEAPSNKERRCQITNEPQSFDRGQDSGQAAITSDKGTGSDSWQKKESSDISLGEKYQKVSEKRGSRSSYNSDK